MFRQRINQELEDGDKINVHLKNRNVRASNEEEDWYCRAFGPKRNFMSIRIKYAPIDGLFKLKRNWFVIIKYKMFDEMIKEIAEEGMKFESVMTIALQEEIGDTELTDYSAKLELPYGTYDCTLVFRLASAVEGDENWELKEPDKKALNFF